MKPSASRTLKIAHITDMHLPQDRQSTVRDVDTYAVLERTLEYIAKRKPDLVLVTGDIANDGGEEPYRELSQLLEPFPGAMVLPGNHDLCPGYAKYFDDAAYQVRQMDGWTLLAVNTAAQNISRDTLSACRQILADNTRVLLATHHPLVMVGTYFFDEMCALENRDQRWQSLITYPSLKAAVFGHTHFAHHSRHGHVQAIGAPAVAFEIIGKPGDNNIEFIKKHGFQFLTLSETVCAEPRYIDL